jgi:hypothetical protein
VCERESVCVCVIDNIILQIVEIMTKKLYMMTKNYSRDN